MSKWFKQFGVFLAALFGAANVSDALNVAIAKLVTPDVQGHLEGVVADLFSSELSGAERKKAAKESLDKAEKGIRLNAAKLSNHLLSRAIDLIVNRQKIENAANNNVYF